MNQDVRYQTVGKPLKMIRVMFFVDVREEQFIKGMHPIGFVPNRKGELVYKDGSMFKIVPLSNNDRGQRSGYRLLFTGEYHHDLLSILSLLYAVYQPYVTGMEMSIDGISRERCIQLAEQGKYCRGELYGSYIHQGISIAFLPNIAFLLYRKRGITKGQLEAMLPVLNEMGEYLLDRKYDLFHYDYGDELEVSV